MGPICTPAFLSTLRAIPHLPLNSWYYLASVSLTLHNRASELPAVLTMALSSSPEPSLTVLNKTREAVLKVAVTGGLPKTINALHAVRRTIHAAPDPSVSSLLDVRSPTARSCLPHDDALARGDEMWAAVYGKVAERVMDGMVRSYKDLGDVAREMYAVVLSEDSVLGWKETGWCLVAALLCAGQGMEPQLRGHKKGCLNNGARLEEVEAVEELAREVGRAVEAARQGGRGKNHRDKGG